VSAGALAPPDGRQSRTWRSRRAICEACLDLVQEGILQPSADQVADRAGLSRRSIFHHFDSLAALYDAVVEAALERCAPLRAEIPRSAPLAERVERLAETRARFYEATTPFRRSLAAQALVGAASAQALRVARALLRAERDEVAALFAPELAPLSAAERAELAEALAAAVSPAAWEHLRTSRALSAARARAVMRRSLAALLRELADGRAEAE
jgi:AcrR family transcriptional regulator